VPRVRRRLVALSATAERFSTGRLVGTALLSDDGPATAPSFEGKSPVMPIATVNWTVIAASAVTGITAVIVGLVGYLSTRVTTSVARQQIEAETGRLRAQHEETRFQDRQNIYREFMQNERAAVALMNDATATIPDRLDGLRDIRNLLNGLLLFGTKEVADQAAAISIRLKEVRFAIGKNERMANDLAAYWTEWRRNLINAMRRDVSPDKEPVEWSGESEL
jgi:hypothetical protein